jgi:hypothetical protein
VIASSTSAGQGTGVLDISLTSGRGGSIGRDAVCSLLTECLQDVSRAIHVMLCLFALLQDFLFFSVSVLGYEINLCCRDYHC